MPSFLSNQLDGNVHRLLSRVLALHAAPKAKQTLDILWAGAAALVKDADRPGDLNQALIELGSTVCKVRDPTCAACPLQSWCAAYRLAQRDATDAVRAEGRQVRNVFYLCYGVLRRRCCSPRLVSGVQSTRRRPEFCQATCRTLKSYALCAPRYLREAP